MAVRHNPKGDVRRYRVGDRLAVLKQTTAITNVDRRCQIVEVHPGLVLESGAPEIYRFSYQFMDDHATRL